MAVLLIARMMRPWRPLLYCVLGMLSSAAPAQASPIRYTFSYEASGEFSTGEGGNPIVQDFSFSFDLDDYTTSAFFALPVPVAVSTGGAAGSQTVTYAGTDGSVWILGTANDTLNLMDFGDGPAIRFVGQVPAGFISAPGSFAFGVVQGATEAEAGGPQWVYEGTATLTVEDLAVAAVPEPATVSLIGLGLAAVGARRIGRARRNR